jgi:hypothetical protein
MDEAWSLPPAGSDLTFSIAKVGADGRVMVFTGNDWVPLENVLRNAAREVVTTACAPANWRDVVREGLSQLRDFASVLPGDLAFRASLWIDRLAGVADTPEVASEISVRALRLVSPLLRGGADGLPAPPPHSTALARGHPPPGDPDA